MSRSIRRRALAALAAAAALAAIAPAAQAAMVDEDTLTLGTGSFTFRSGHLFWHHNAGIYDTYLTGDMRIDDANGSCARMRLVYFDDGEELTTRYGGTVCAEDGKAHTYHVSLNPYSSPRIDLVKVSLQKQTARAGWTTVESKYFGPDFTADKVRLTSDGVDFGDGTWGIGSPLGSGRMAWVRKEDGMITPRLTGGLFLNNMGGTCARMLMTYVDAGGGEIATEHGGSVCSPDNARHRWDIDLDPFSSTRIDSVVVAMQTQATNGTWHTIDTWWPGTPAQQVFKAERE